MPKLKTTSVEQYLAALPADRRTIVEAVRKLVRRHLPRGYEEAVNWNMIVYQVPLERYPHTYNGQPLAYVALAAQKQYFALYLLGVYQREAQAALAEAFAAAGKTLDMGKSCVRFRSLDDLPLDVVAGTIASLPPDRYIAEYDAIQAGRAAARKASASKTSARAATGRIATGPAATRRTGARTAASTRSAPRARTPARTRRARTIKKR